MVKKQPIYIFIHLPKNGGTSFVANLNNKLNENEICSSVKVPSLPIKEKDKIKIIIGHETYYGIHKYFPNREPRYIIFIRNPAERRVSQYNHDMARLNENKKIKKKISFNKWYSLQIKDEQVFLCNKKFKGIPGRKAPNFTNNFITRFKVGDNKLLKFLGFKLLKLFYSKRTKEKRKQEFENAKKLLDKCWMVSTTNNLDKDLPKLFKTMRLPTEWEHYRKTKTIGEKLDKNKIEVEKVFTLDKKTRQEIYNENLFDLELYEYATKKSYKLG